MSQSIVARSAAAVAFAALLLVAVARGEATEPAAPFVVRGARLFDGEHSRGLQDVYVQDGRIAAVGAHLRVPAGTPEVAGDGRTLLPGLIDAHTHVFGAALQEAISFGVTTEFDQFTEVHMAADVRAKQARGEMSDVADLFSAGTLVTAPKGHGTEYGLTIPTISTPDEAQAFVDARLSEGSEWIKIVYDDGHAYGMHIPTLDLPTLRAVIAAAHVRGKLAVVHIGDQRAAREAIESGADALVHLFVDTAPEPGFAKLVAKHHAFIIPTLTVNESVTGVPTGASLLADPRLAPLIDPTSAANLKASFPARTDSPLRFAYALSTVQQLKAVKVPLLAGTDAPNPGTAHGASLHRELELLVQAGLTPAEALTAATAAPAKAFRLQDRGRIAKGLRADLLLVQGDPTTTITDTRNLVAVWKRGVPVDLTAHRARVAEAAAVPAPASPSPEGLAAGRISDFEDGTSRSAFGAGWSVTSDQMRGGTSTATLAVVDGGANGSAKSLAVEGTVTDSLPFGWAGAFLSPGAQPFQPVDLSSKREIRFFARGDGKAYSIMVFAESRGMQPILRPFTSTSEWQEFVLPFEQFDGIDGHDIRGFAFTAVPNAGPFRLQLDEVELR